MTNSSVVVSKHVVLVYCNVFLWHVAFSIRQFTQEAQIVNMTPCMAVFIEAIHLDSMKLKLPSLFLSACVLDRC